MKNLKFRPGDIVDVLLPYAVMTGEVSAVSMKTQIGSTEPHPFYNIEVDRGKCLIVHVPESKIKHIMKR